MSNIQKIIGIIAGGAIIASGAYFLNQSSNSNTGDTDYSTTRTNLSTGEADKDCSDFKTQNEAQVFFETNGGPNSDPHNLDRDKDGKVCESLK
ncbi:MAG: excalibur calcium-binding domain-containing protein [bacterium]|nr:excalibur calcium-binding domain-containing protein [bacterium]